MECDKCCCFPAGKGGSKKREVLTATSLDVNFEMNDIFQNKISATLMCLTTRFTPESLKRGTIFCSSVVLYANRMPVTTNDNST